MKNKTLLAALLLNLSCSIPVNQNIELAVNSYRRGYVQAIIDINMNYTKLPKGVTVTGDFTSAYLREYANKKADKWRVYLNEK